MTLDAIQHHLRDAGLNLFGALPAEVYDEIAPTPWQSRSIDPACRSVLVVGNGGRALWPHFREAPEAKLGEDPLDHYTERVLCAAARLARPPAEVATYTERRDGSYLPMMALAERAGFGAPGRVGVLLHPEFGPWIAIRGILFLQDSVPFREPRAFDPCNGCPAPCQIACHGSAVGPDGVNVEQCFRTKILKRACRADCDARRACVIGPEHTYSDDQIAHHSRIRWKPATVRRAITVLARRR